MRTPSYTASSYITVHPNLGMCPLTSQYRHVLSRSALKLGFLHNALNHRKWPNGLLDRLMDTKNGYDLASPNGNYSNILWHNPVILVDSTKQDATAQTPAQKSFLRHCGTYKKINVLQCVSMMNVYVDSSLPRKR